MPHEHAGFCRWKLLRNKRVRQVKPQVKSHDGWTVGNAWKKEKGESIEARSGRTLEKTMTKTQAGEGMRLIPISTG